MQKHADKFPLNENEILSPRLREVHGRHQWYEDQFNEDIVDMIFQKGDSRPPREQFVGAVENSKEFYWMFDSQWLRAIALMKEQGDFDEDEDEEEESTADAHLQKKYAFLREADQPVASGKLSIREVEMIPNWVDYTKQLSLP